MKRIRVTIVFDFYLPFMLLFLVVFFCALSLVGFVIKRMYQ